VLKVLRALFRSLWKTWFLLCFTISFLLLFPFFFYALVRKKYDRVYRLKRFWSKIIAWGSLLFPKVIYKRGKKYTLPKPCIIVCNHTSYLDIILSPFYIDHTAVYMGKSELLKAPLFKYFFIYLDIPVNRKSIKDSHRAFSEAGRKIDEGLSQVIYPEGTISSDGHLKAFKNGAFRLAIEKQVPIVPVVNLNNWKYLQNGGFLTSYGRPGRPLIVVGDPVDTVGMGQAQLYKLKDKVRNFIEQELEKRHGGKN
jgi:1-acyl-sn-glycerol-3-phosphate acyltransferase